jgi:hypothetical protein
MASSRSACRLRSRMPPALLPHYGDDQQDSPAGPGWRAAGLLAVQRGFDDDKPAEAVG